MTWRGAWAVWGACWACGGPPPVERVRLIDVLPSAQQLPSPRAQAPLASVTAPEPAPETPNAVAFPVEPQRGFVVRVRLHGASGTRRWARLSALTAEEFAQQGGAPRPVSAPLGRRLGPCHVSSTGADGTVVCQRFDHVGRDRSAVLVEYVGGAADITLWDAEKPDARGYDHPLLTRLVHRVGHLTDTGISWRSALVGDHGAYVLDVPLPASPELWLGLGYEQGSRAAPARFRVRLDGVVVLDETAPVDDRWHDFRVPLTRSGPGGRLELETVAADGSPSPTGAMWSDPRVVSAHSARPNVLLLTLDAVRPDHLMPYGYGRDTSPTLAEVARSGVMFASATSQAGRTWESLSALFTGLYPVHTRVRANGVPLPADVPMLPELLAAAGYDSFAGTDLGLFPPIYESAFDEAELVPAQGKASPQAQLRRLAPGLHRGGQFIWFHLEHAHYPLIPTEPLRYDPGYQGRFAAAFTHAEHDAFPHPEQLTPAEHAHLTALYDASIRDADQELFHLLETLNALEVLDNTVLVIAADHGEQLGEHGAVLEHVTPYEAVLHVPLFISWEGHVTAGTRVPVNVQLIDVAPTLLSLLKVRAATRFDGRDLSPALRGEPLPDAPAYAELLGQVFSLQQGREHLLWSASGFHATFQSGWRIDLPPRALYDLSKDPDELRDLTAEEPARAEALTAKLEARTRGWRDGGTEGNDAPLSQAAFEALQQAGYVTHLGAVMDVAAVDAGVAPP
jgi:arylsulfatase A-like enzyme